MENEVTVEALPVDSDTVIQLLEFILNIPVVGEYLPVIFAVVTVASTIASFTKTPAKGTWLGLIYKVVIDLPALNVFKAKDKG
jgi:hypothetical protein